MSYTFNVSYQNVSKKVSCVRSATVNDLILTSFQKFNVPLSNNGVLTYSGKKLDGLLPIRLSNLVNNAKLELSVSSMDSVVTLKVVAAIGDESITKIIKVASSATLAVLVDEFRSKAEISSDWSDKRIQLSVLQAVKDNLTSDFAQISVASVVGSATNAVLRLLVENKDAQQKRIKFQEEQRVLRQELEEKRRQERLLKKDEEQRLEEKKKLEDKNAEVEENDVEMEDVEETKNLAVAADEAVNTLPHKGELPESSTGILTQNISHSSNSGAITGSGGDELSKEPSHFEVVQEKEDTLYVPSTRSAIYENPDDDYNMTMNQAEKYYKIIKSMQGGPKVAKEVTKPQKYVIRIRFPDRSLLDLPIDDPSIKLGQLLKKIDGYVAEKFINTYKLKNGLPPFKEIAVGFSQNSVALVDHPDFQLEKILLIWEPAISNSKGPYLSEGIVTKDASQLPTLQLESHRGELEKDEVTAPKPIVKTDGKKKSSGVPKWFRK